MVADPFRNHEELIQITDSSDSDPTWSPDGTQIAFVRTQGENGLYVANADGSGTLFRLLRDVGFYGEDLTWSLDGTKSRMRSTPARTSRRHARVRAGHRHGHTADLGLGRSPSWSPDGSKIAFEVPVGSDWDIYWMNPDGTGRLVLLPLVGPDDGAVLVTEGTWMAFHRSDGIYRYNWTNGSVSLITAGTDSESATWGALQPACQRKQATISGTPGNDILRGSNGVDVIHGMAGDDTIIGLQGQDVICGGPGVDTVSYAGQTAPAIAYLGEIAPTAGVSDLIASDVENLVGGSGPDTLVGDHRTNVIEGGDGADQITGGGSGDTLTGGRGDDVVVGGEGVDKIAGSGGDDLLVGDDGDDIIRGDDGDDVLRGGGDNDSLDGGPTRMFSSAGPG